MKFGPSAWVQQDIALQREWLMSNGIGGYASTSITGANLRRYHGLLVASAGLEYERILILSQISETILLEDSCYNFLSYTSQEKCHSGEARLQSFEWLGMPVWKYLAGQISLEKQAVLVYGQNVSVIRYRIRNGRLPVTLQLTPLLNYRNHHFLSYNQYLQFDVDYEGRHILINPYATKNLVHVECSEGQIRRREQSWFYNMDYLHDKHRGYSATEDHFTPAYYEIDIGPWETKTVTLRVELEEKDNGVADEKNQTRLALASSDGELYINNEVERLSRLPLFGHHDPFVSRLSQAADQFVAKFPCKDTKIKTSPAYSDAYSASQEEARDEGSQLQNLSELVIKRNVSGNVSLVSGYPWTGPWGRDTLIALPGLLLTTKRYSEAADLLASISARISRGLLGNSFTHSETHIEDLAADGPLWLFEAVWKYYVKSADIETVIGLLPALEDIVKLHASSAIVGMNCDHDGLLSIEKGNTTYTWMNSRIGSWVVNPRIGKAVEINALWYNALCVLSRLRKLGTTPECKSSAKGSFTESFHKEDSTSAGNGLIEIDSLAETVFDNFQKTFWNDKTQCLLDTSGSDNGEASIRPNQIFACSLSFPVLKGERAKTMMETVYSKLYTPFGLRSLSPCDSKFISQYSGDQYSRETAMHQGTVWTWLLGPFVTAWRRTHADDSGCAEFLNELFEPIKVHLDDGCIGTIGELADGQYPYMPRGCPSKAWSVAELLRAYMEDVLDENQCKPLVEK